MQLLRVAWALTGAAICCFLILLIHSRLLKEVFPYQQVAGGWSIYQFCAIEQISSSCAEESSTSTVCTEY
ncbi:hypothetical protein D9C73_025106 [Collichthys lucidus]|uniref:Uncharacterized protein n=1 Tax=Collichthys lucidus TaxID=240159 RepID=A0A4U5VQU6_COLLU|nr:hypothetical protein D9C73_025106 [Collichthys lucidus]